MIETEIPAEMKPHFNVVGSIDLDNLAKTKSEPEQPTSPIPAEEHEKEQNVIPEEPEVTIAPEAETKEQPLAEDKKPTTPEKPADAAPPIEAEKPAATVETTTDEPATKAGQTHEDEAVPAEETVMQGRESVDTEENETASVADDAGKDITPTQPVAEEAEEVKAEGETTDTDDVVTEEAASDSQGKLFRLHKNKLESNIVVKGSIDLDSINDRTRPQRKSRAQRKKERLEREQKTLDGKKLKDEKVKLLKKEAIDEKKKPVTGESEEDLKKKKRKRIRTGKVNIEKPGSFGQSARGDRKPSLRKPIKAEVSEVDVQKQIKETLARLTEKRGKKGGAKYRREKREASAHRQQEELMQQEQQSRVLQLTEFVTANDLANMMNIPVTNVISTCMSLGVMVAINQRLDAETINIVAEEYGFKTQFVSAEVIELSQRRKMRRKIWCRALLL